MKKVLKIEINLSMKRNETDIYYYHFYSVYCDTANATSKRKQMYKNRKGRETIAKKKEKMKKVLKNLQLNACI